MGCDCLASILTGEQEAEHDPAELRGLNGQFCGRLKVDHALLGSAGEIASEFGRSTLTLSNQKGRSVPRAPPRSPEPLGVAARLILGKQYRRELGRVGRALSWA